MFMFDANYFTNQQELFYIKMKLCRLTRSTFGLFILFCCLFQIKAIVVNVIIAQTILTTIPLDNIGAIAINPETNRVYASREGAIHVIDGKSNIIIDTIEGLTGGADRGIGINTETGLVYAANLSEGTVDVVDGESNKVIATIKVWEGSGPVFEPFPPVFSAEGVAVNSITNRIYISHFPGGIVSVIDGKSNSVIAEIDINEAKDPHLSAAQGLEVNESKNHIYVADEKESVIAVISGESNQVIDLVKIEHPPFNVSLNLLANHLYATSQQSKAVSVVDMELRRIVANVDVDCFSTGSEVIPSIDRIYVTSPECNKVRIIDCVNNQVIGAIDMESGPVAIAANSVTDLVYIGAWKTDCIVVHDDGSTIPEPEPEPEPGSGSGSEVKLTDFRLICENGIHTGPNGIEKLTLKLGELESCFFKMDNSLAQCDLKIEILTNHRLKLKTSVKVKPAAGIADENGELALTIRGISRGVDWVAWAVEDENGEFKFDKDAYANGNAWGLFVEVK